MKTINQFLSVVMIACLPVSAEFAAEQVRDYPVSKIAPHTYVIHGPLAYPSAENQGFMNNPGFVVTQAGVVLVDPGSSVQAGRMVLKQIRSVTKKPVTHVFNTHVHGDHWLGNQAVIEAYPKAKLLAHPAMIEKLKEGEGEQWVKMMDNLTGGYTKGTRVVPPTVLAADSSVFKTGGMTFRIYAPENAHSKTDIMIEAVEDSVIFTGDNVFNQIVGRLVDGSFAGSIAACDKIIAVKAKHYVPGHGPTGDVRVVQQFRDYLATLYGTVKQQYALGKADFEMKDFVVEKLKPYQNWNRFTTEIGPLISQAVLEVEQAM